MSASAKYAIIVAGGSGQRMGSKIPKQFLAMKGRPILMYTIEVFHRYSPDMPLILVLPEPHMKTWEQLCDRYKFNLPVSLCEGGASRFQSVKKGLGSIEGEDGLVAIHDGVRPLVNSEIIERSFNSAKKHHSGVAAIPLKDSIREVHTEGSRAVDRNDYRIVQTPQTFDLKLIKKAYSTGERNSYTDDASVWEAAGHAVHLISGSENNLKITTIQDLVVAELLMKLK